MKEIKHKFEAIGISVETKIVGKVDKEVVTVYRVLVRAINQYMQEVMDRVAKEKLSNLKSSKK